MMTDLPVTIAAVRDAAAAIAGAIAHTPVIAAPALSELAGAEIYLKLETLHRTGSFKERGALTKLLTLDAAERRAGVVAMSAGNHAQGVAYHARRLGIPATIVMPEGTPFIKIDRTEAFGAKVVLKGDSLAAAREAADALARERGLVLVHPYDDPAVIAGQGTIALELLADRAGSRHARRADRRRRADFRDRGRRQGAQAGDRDHRRAVDALPVDVPAAARRRPGSAGRGRNPGRRASRSRSRAG